MMMPMLIFNKYCKPGMGQRHKALRISRGIQGKIGDQVGPGIVFTQLVAGRREEGQYDARFRILLPDRLKDRAPLFELANRSAMHPYPVSLHFFQSCFQSP